VALLGNTLATASVLAVLIAVFAPISGAHLNPAVTLVTMARKKLPAMRATAFMLSQFAGCCFGALLAHGMFELPLVQDATQARTGAGQWIAEGVATSGLILVAFTSPTAREAAWRVPAWIAGAYWFTASTSFANPAITIARSLSDTFAGIRPQDTPGFLLAQLAGAAVGLLLLRMLAERAMATASPSAATASGEDAK
jgi:glycerol uptake facilitator-like aquaporin